MIYLEKESDLFLILSEPRNLNYMQAIIVTLCDHRPQNQKQTRRKRQKRFAYRWSIQLCLKKLYLLQWLWKLWAPALRAPAQRNHRTQKDPGLHRLQMLHSVNFFRRKRKVRKEEARNERIEARIVPEKNLYLMLDTT